MNHEEYESMVKLANEFENGIAIKLQRYLWLKSWYFFNLTILIIFVLFITFLNLSVARNVITVTFINLINYLIFSYKFY